ncbi:unnamed protein product [Microthlaspi erraticum]|uniref:Uncharacterized protein n=1 Tax=Microthlaspi erraticum TaxID=1685480 RepID=A0A6D2IU17_9BRAS|nr:unnamed protein product [Microthlaspi erraticum]
MTRRSNKDNLVEHPEIDKLEKQLRKQKAQEMADEAARAHAAEVARAQEEGRDPPPPPPNPQDPAGDVNAQPQAGAPTIGDYDSADAFFMDRNPIHPPPPARNDYEIKPQIIALVRQNQFNGLPAEHPLDHIENFEEICSTTRSNGVSADYLEVQALFILSWRQSFKMVEKRSYTKRVKTVQTALSREQRPNRAVRLAEERCSALGQSSSVRLKSRPKSKTTRPITHHDPGNSSPRSATPHRHATAHDQSARAGKSLAAAQLASRTTAERSVRPGSNVPRPAERFHRPNSIRSTTPTDRESVRPIVPTRHDRFRLGHDPIVRPIVPHDRPNAAVDPKPLSPA